MGQLHDRRDQALILRNLRPARARHSLPNGSTMRLSLLTPAIARLQAAHHRLDNDSANLAAPLHAAS
jgi:hypothetical protein